MNEIELRKEILQRLYGKCYRYITKDSWGQIHAHTRKPRKLEMGWNSNNDEINLFLFNDLFEDVTFEDKEPLCIIEWSTIPKDTKVLVSRDGKWWTKRYFKEYQENSEKPFIVYAEGATSWSAAYGGLVAEYEYCKLAEEEQSCEYK